MALFVSKEKTSRLPSPGIIPQLKLYTTKIKELNMINEKCARKWSEHLKLRNLREQVNSSLSAHGIPSEIRGRLRQRSCTYEQIWLTRLYMTLVESGSCSLQFNLQYRNMETYACRFPVPAPTMPKNVVPTTVKRPKTGRPQA